MYVCMCEPVCVCMTHTVGVGLHECVYVCCVRVYICVLCMCVCVCTCVCAYVYTNKDNLIVIHFLGVDFPLTVYNFFENSKNGNMRLIGRNSENK